MTYEIGQRIRTRPQKADGHTRLPKYLERRDGLIVQKVGAFPFSDDRAENPSSIRNETLYTVEFEQGTHRVRADLFESYLEALP
jgi:hypothetical protein